MPYVGEGMKQEHSPTSGGGQTGAKVLKISLGEFIPDKTADPEILL